MYMLIESPKSGGELRQAFDTLDEVFGTGEFTDGQAANSIAIGLEIDESRVCKQIDWRGRVYHNKYTNIARCRITVRVETITYEVNGTSDTEHPPFYSMYDSWALLGFRPKALNIKNV